MHGNNRLIRYFGLLGILLLCTSSAAAESTHWQLGPAHGRYTVDETPLQHLGFTTLQSGATETLLRATKLTKRQRYWASALSCSAVWVGKEYFVDLHPDTLDILADLAGCFGGADVTQRCEITPTGNGLRIQWRWK